MVLVGAATFALAEVGYTEPGGEPDAQVVAASEAFVRWHIGEWPWQRGCSGPARSR